MKLIGSGRSSRLARLAVGVVSLGLIATACGGGGTEAGGGGGGAAKAAGETIVLGNIGWKEDVALNTLWTRILEDRGYDVQVKTLSANVIFSGLARDNLDLFLDAWLPNTHSTYMNQFGDSLVKVGPWYPEGTLEWTVPSYMENINSISDLQGKAQMFNGQITGIGPSAGLTRISKNEVIPQYNLGDSYNLKISSSSAMVGALDRAIAAKQPIVVTLWHPHVAYTRYDLKDLEDPKGALGQGEKLWVLSREGFADTHPEVAQWLKNFQLTQDQLRQLEDLMFNQFPDDHQKAVDQWISNHQNLVNQWVGGSGA